MRNGNLAPLGQVPFNKDVVTGKSDLPTRKSMKRKLEEWWGCSYACEHIRTIQDLVSKQPLQTKQKTKLVQTGVSDRTQLPECYHASEINKSHKSQWKQNFTSEKIIVYSVSFVNSVTSEAFLNAAQRHNSCNQTLFINWNTEPIPKHSKWVTEGKVLIREKSKYMEHGLSWEVNSCSTPIPKEKSPAYYRTWRFFTVFTAAHHGWIKRSTL